MFINPINSYSLNFTANKPLYLVNKQGERKKYESRSALAEDLQCSVTMVVNAMNRKKSSLRSGYVIDAKDIEKKDEKGNIEVDERKLENKIRFLTRETALYEFDLYNGTYQRFQNQTDASRELNLKNANVSACIKGINSRVKNYTFVKAQDIERVTDDGTIVIDRKKLIRILNSSLKASPAIYSIDLQGNYEKYENACCFAKEMGVSHAHISNCVNYGFCAKSHRLVRAGEVEYFNEEGQLIVDEAKIRSLAPKTSCNYSKRSK